MDIPEDKSTGLTNVSELQKEIQSLRQLITSLLLLLVVVSGTLSIFLLRQWKMARNDLAAIRPGALQIINDYNQQRAPRMDAFIQKLKEYGRTHPDFVPILERYQLVTNPPTVSAPIAPPKK
jgi:hypothetical protein